MSSTDQYDSCFIYSAVSSIKSEERVMPKSLVRRTTLTKGIKLAFISENMRNSLKYQRENLHVYVFSG
jgi:hypothetical protein